MRVLYVFTLRLLFPSARYGTKYGDTTRKVMAGLTALSDVFPSTLVSLQHREKSNQTADFGVTRCALVHTQRDTHTHARTHTKALLMQTNPDAVQNELPL